MQTRHIPVHARMLPVHGLRGCQNCRFEILKDLLHSSGQTATAKKNSSWLENRQFHWCLVEEPRWAESASQFAKQNWKPNEDVSMGSQSKRERSQGLA